MMELYELIVKQTDAILEEETWAISVMANTAALLIEMLEQVNWAGFYLVRDVTLHLGPFRGKPACMKIAKGKGVCGTAWEKDDTQLVPDVHAFPGHIACDGASRSEIVIPIHKDGEVAAVLDIDSPVPGRFTMEDQQGLEEVVRLLERTMTW